MVSENQQTEEKTIRKLIKIDDEIYSKISKDVVMSNEESRLRKRQ